MSQITLLDATRYPMELTGTPGQVTCRVEFNIGRNAKQIDSIRWMVRDRTGETIHADRKRTFVQTLPAGHYSVQLTLHYTDKTKSMEMHTFDLTRTGRGVVLRAPTLKKVAAAALKASAPAVRGEATVKVKVGSKTVAKKVSDIAVGDKLAPVRKNKAFLQAQAHANAIVEFEADVKKVEGVRVKLTPIPGVDFKGAIRALYSATFHDHLSGKRSVVKQLIARLAEVVDPTKAHICVVDANGNAVAPGTHLAKLRG